MNARFSSAEEAARWVEAECKRLMATINDDVVPALRRDGGQALRTLSEKLHQLAETLDRNRPPKPPAPPLA